MACCACWVCQKDSRKNYRTLYQDARLQTAISQLRADKCRQALLLQSAQASIKLPPIDYRALWRHNYSSRMMIRGWILPLFLSL